MTDIIPPDAAEAVRKRLCESLRYVGELRDRIQHRGALPNEPLLMELRSAYDALHAACVDLHYLSCTSGVCASGQLVGPPPDLGSHGPT